jgi:ADP-ribose pyrophosphatase
MKKLNEKIVYEGKWLSVLETICENKHGEIITWETVRRKKSSVGVVVLARLMPSKKFILIRQYRPSIQGYILGLPAGLAFDDPHQAIKELKEETGYTGTIVNVSPILKTGSSLINDSGRIITIDVDEHDPANQNPQQELEPAEDIEVCLVDRSNAIAFLLQEHERGIHISSNLWYMFGLMNLLAE